MSDLEKCNDLLEKLKEKNLPDYEHSLRVQKVANAIINNMDFPEEYCNMLSICAALHDIGTLKISNDILNKPSRLSVDEHELIQEHVENFEDLIRDFEQKEDMIPVIRHHHENVNGFGYPD